MVKNKRSLLVIGTLVRIIIMLVVVFFLIIPACNKVRDFFINPERDYISSFEGFVEFVNVELAVGDRDDFEIEIDAKRAIIGFSKDADKFECINCWDKDKTLVYDKPIEKDECQGTACICLCRDELKFGDPIESGGKKAKVGTCEFLCKPLIQDIVTQTITANIRGDTIIIWNNGFMFSSLLPLSNGLGEVHSFTKILFVDKTLDTIAVCNKQMLKHNDAIGISTCTGSAQPIPAEVIEAGEEAIREHVLKTDFEGFVDIIDGIETHDVDPATICHKILDLNNFKDDEIITFDKVGDKGVVSLKKIEGKNLVDISQPREIGRVIPYAPIARRISAIEYHLGEESFQYDTGENFRNYILRPNARGTFRSPPYFTINFQGSSNQKAVLIHGNGRWILTTNEDVRGLIGQLGPLCWTTTGEAPNAGTPSGEGIPPVLTVPESSDNPLPLPP